jgi:hypothetical protein
MGPSRGVHAHLAAERRQDRRVIEIITGPVTI